MDKRTFAEKYIQEKKKKLHFNYLHPAFDFWDLGLILYLQPYKTTGQFLKYVKAILYFFSRTVLAFAPSVFCLWSPEMNNRKINILLLATMYVFFYRMWHFEKWNIPNFLLAEWRWGLSGNWEWGVMGGATLLGGRSVKCYVKK